MKKISAIIMAVLLAAALCSCSTDTYTESSKSKNFLLKNVESVTLSGPAAQTGGDNTVVVLNSQNGQQFVDFVEKVKGEKLDSLPDSHFFGMALMVFTTKYGEEIKAYPANDGSNYIQLYSLNQNTCKYLEIPEEDMKLLTQAFESNGISVNYGS